MRFYAEKESGEKEDVTVQIPGTSPRMTGREEDPRDKPEDDIFGA